MHSVIAAEEQRPPTVSPSPSIFILVASIGRADCLCKLMRWLASQTRPVDGIIVVGVSPDDVAGVAEASTLPVEVALWQKGLTRQRNHAIERAHGRADIILFLDDDFVPSRTYVAELEAAFAADRRIIGITGRVIKDGVRGEGIAFEDAVSIVERDTPPGEITIEDKQGLYGCNMAFRMNAIDGLRFDEWLPLYGWQEDVDFGFRVSARGRVVRMNTMSGVHMGAKGARTSGKRLGYSQVANPVYLLRKGTIRPRLAYRIMVRNMVTNMVNSIRPEPTIDRRGRALGNLLAIRDLCIGRIHPERVLDL